ncbi:ornithine cyclodeaminase family protein [Anaeromicrobium sediminis]|uniref:Ornithine cyclodeaminase n=1 Tax=Anaeromicrobium sediminis TaxID=1478221 RepID=A0A267MBW3_9FIRM|nr:ornithine cyclodeaminase family protein [Anaeromicrobium sediminis]PAB57026.1 hypothetical protein CCE28_19800 [Anaeromicrobium sediminis]
MRIINEETVRKYLTMSAGIRVMEDTLKALSNEDVVQKLRMSIHLEENNIFGLMPSYLKYKNVFGAKVISVFPENKKRFLPSHQGIVVLFENTSGQLVAIVDGEGITAVRTAAVSAVATRALSREDSEILTIMGTGVQAKSHIEAILLVRPIKKIKIWDYKVDYAEAFVETLRSELDLEIEYYKSAKDALSESDIVCTVTSARTPIIKREWLKTGVHINAVGSCTPDAREIDSETMRDCTLFVDSLESATHEAGDYLIPLKEGIIKEGHIKAEIGHVLTQKKAGRTSDEEITLFEALGLSIEDIAAAYYIYEKVQQ